MLINVSVRARIKDESRVWTPGAGTTRPALRVWSNSPALEREFDKHAFPCKSVFSAVYVNLRVLSRIIPFAFKYRKYKRYFELLNTECFHASGK